MATTVAESVTAVGIAAAIDVSIKGVSVDQFRNHIKKTLPHNVVKTYQLSKSKGHRVYGKIILRPSVNQVATVEEYAQKLRHSTLDGQPIHAQVDKASLIPLLQLKSNPTATAATAVDDDDDADAEEKRGALDWKDAKAVASSFFYWLHEGSYSPLSDSVDLTSVDRELVHRLFETFLGHKQTLPGADNTRKKTSNRRLESLVMASLRALKRMKTKRYSDGVVICSFARKDLTFPPIKERKTKADKIREGRQQLEANKGGVCVAEAKVTPSLEVYPINQTVSVEFPIEIKSDEAHLPLRLVDVYLGGSHGKHFSLVTTIPGLIESGNQSGESNKTEETTISSLKLTFRPRGSAMSRLNIQLTFKDAIDEIFSILRTVSLRSGDADMYDALKPTSPFQKKKRKFEKPVSPENILNPPPEPGRGENIFKDLKLFKPPLDVREMVTNGEIEGALVGPTYDTPDNELPEVYSKFWQNLLWVSELQAYEDIKLFDMEDASLQRHGRFFKLYVSGLAEGRPSVLRGDMVLCTWKGKQYRGRVFAVEQLDVLLEFHSSFHKNFNVNIDKMELIRFTFSRTTFRTAHHGTRGAPKNMGASMLMPKKMHVESIKTQGRQNQPRKVPPSFAWTSRTLNDEQKLAVTQISKGEMKPLPYIIFGPPGTGKTTTVVEAVYQLAHLKGDNKEKLKILLVAPSNDATDVLVEKLAPFFPPSEMLRVLAYSRSVDQVSSIVRPYVKEGLASDQWLAAIMSVQIVVSTVNMAARFWCNGISKGYFDVLCVDEAGHATEPEVIAAASTLIDFKSSKNPGQLVLAGDPMQLGPIIASPICKKFGMSVSYMERLIKTSPAYNNGDNESNPYPTELVTFLVRNYRSHPAILKLPNEMFYRNKLLPCGDHMSTHRMVRWEHLPSKKSFPIIFHAVDGENLREGTSPSWYNPQECVEVVNYVDLLVKQSKPPIRKEDIGIITPYARQVQKIRVALKVKDLGDISVGSVEAFQGQERSCIIISTVRSESEHLSHDLKYNLGFVANEKRFNVAVTRAKALLVVIGNPRVLASDKKNWLPFLRYCHDNDSWYGEEWDELDAPLDNDDVARLSDRLESTKIKDDESHSDHGWEVLEYPSATIEQEALGFINREE